MAASITNLQPRQDRGAADVHHFPTRTTVASEAFTSLIQYLMPDAPRAFLDLPMTRAEPWLTAYLESDEPADRLVAALHREGRGLRNQFEQAVEHGIKAVDDPSPELVAFFESVDQLPTSIDMQLVEEGALCLRRIDPLTAVSAGWVIGFLLAAVLPNTARALAGNGRAVDDPTQRGIETGKFVMDTLTPGGYQRFGAGTKTACRLRVMHAAVRQNLRRDGSWDEAVLGVPISLADTAGAGLGWNLMIMQSARQTGYHFSEREQEAVGHFAACAMARQGIPARLLAITVAEQEEMLYIGLRSARANIEPNVTARVMPAMLRFDIPFLPTFARPFGRKLIAGYARLMLGEALCDASGIPDTQLKHAIRHARLPISAAERARTTIPGANRLAARAGDLVWDQLAPRLLQLGDDDATHYQQLGRQDQSG